MKSLTVLAISLFALESCVFEAPFVAEAKIPIEMKLLGRWESADVPGDSNPEKMLVLQHSANEYVVAYPLGGDSMVFRAFPVKLEGHDFIQIQLIGTVKGPVDTKDRKYHLLNVKLDGDTLELSTIDPDVLGGKPKTTDELTAAFRAHADDPKLFQEAKKFHRLK